MEVAGLRFAFAGATSLLLTPVGLKPFGWLKMSSRCFAWIKNLAFSRIFPSPMYTAIVVVEHGLEEAAASSLAPLAEDAVDFHVGCV